MFKTLRDKMTLSGTTVLMIGVALLIFTFVSAYAFLTQSLSIVTSGDLAQTFGEALAPLIATSVHIMYLGVMGWVSSILTIRGVTILSQARQTNVAPEELLTTAKEKTQTKTKEKEPEKAKEPEVKTPETKPKETKPEEPKPKETKPYEPEIIVLTPEPLPQKQQQVIPQEKKENH